MLEKARFRWDGKQEISKTPAIRKDTKDRDIDRKQLTQTKRARRDSEIRRLSSRKQRDDGDGGMGKRCEGKGKTEGGRGCVGSEFSYVRSKGRAGQAQSEYLR